MILPRILQSKYGHENLNHCKTVTEFQGKNNKSLSEYIYIYISQIAFSSNILFHFIQAISGLDFLPEMKTHNHDSYSQQITKYFNKISTAYYFFLTVRWE